MNSNRTRSRIENWLFRQRASYRDAARYFGCSHAYVRAVATGERAPTGEIARRIVDAAAANLILPSSPAECDAAGASPAGAQPAPAGAFSSTGGR